jgi:hypothetical protein
MTAGKLLLSVVLAAGALTVTTPQAQATYYGWGYRGYPYYGHRSYYRPYAHYRRYYRYRPYYAYRPYRSWPYHGHHTFYWYEPLVGIGSVW